MALVSREIPPETKLGSEEPSKGKLILGSKSTQTFPAYFSTEKICLSIQIKLLAVILIKKSRKRW